MPPGEESCKDEVQRNIFALVGSPRLNQDEIQAIEVTFSRSETARSY